MGAVERRSVDIHAQLGRLNDGVLLRVDGVAHLVPRAGGNAELFAQAFAALHARFHARRRAVIAGGHHALILDDNRADFSLFLIAARPGRNELRHFHKTVIPLGKHLSLLFAGRRPAPCQKPEVSGLPDLELIYGLLR